MFTALAILLAVWASPAWSALLSAGQVHTCAWDGRADEPAACWGNNDHGQLGSPAKKWGRTDREVAGQPILKNPKQIVSGAWHTCALHQDAAGKPKIECWGYPQWDLLNVPASIVRPIQISAGKWHNCALFEPGPGTTEVRCWGRNESEQRDVPRDLEAPSAVFAGPDYTCARHGVGNIRCWGSVRGNFPAADFPKVIPGSELTCTLPVGASKPDCWTNHRDRTKPYVRHARRGLDCTLDDRGVKCKDDHGRETAVPNDLKSPRDLAVGEWHACALHDDGVKCWGENDEGQLLVPSPLLAFGPYVRNLSETVLFLQLLSEFGYEFDAEFLASTAALIRPGDEAQAHFVLLALRSYFVGFNYPFVRDAYLRRAVLDIDEISRRRGARELMDARQTPLVTETGFRMLASGIQSAKKLLTIEENAKAEIALAGLGDAIATGKPPGGAAKTELTALLRSFRTKGYLSGRGASMEAILKFLGGE